MKTVLTLSFPLGLLAGYLLLKSDHIHLPGSASAPTSWNAPQEPQDAEPPCEAPRERPAGELTLIQARLQEKEKEAKEAAHGEADGMPAGEEEAVPKEGAVPEEEAIPEEGAVPLDEAVPGEAASRKPVETAPLFPPAATATEESGADSFRLVMPTENRALIDADPSSFYMHTDRFVDGINLKPWEGGQYGYVRNPLSTSIGPVFTRFHEGIDIRPVRRDEKGNPLDTVGAIADGVVVHVSSSARASNYGKYIVVRHDWPEGAFYSLYAHLMTTEVSLGQGVTAGDKLGRLGYTGDGIDRERAHLHMELNFLLSEHYHAHFSTNGQGNFHGSNLLGIDVGRFLRERHANPGLTMKEFFRGEEPYCKVRTASPRKPGILVRHPFLGEEMDKEAEAKSWELTLASTGIPLAIRPSEIEQKFPIVAWVKTMNTNHSYMTSGRLSGSGSKAQLTTSGHQFISLISESFASTPEPDPSSKPKPKPKPKSKSSKSRRR